MTTLVRFPFCMKHLSAFSDKFHPNREIGAVFFALGIIWFPIIPLLDVVSGLALEV